MSDFLSSADIEALTGYRRPAYQVAWLKRHGLLLHVNARGRPVVLRSVVEGREQAKKSQIDWSKLNVGALAATDAKSMGRDPTALLGHTNAQTTRRYTRGMETTTVEPLRRKR